MIGGFNADALREGQRQALEVIVDRYRAAERYTAVVLPTRYGKSDLMRVAAAVLWQDGLCPVALALSPNTVLRDQLVDGKKWRQAVARYALTGAELRFAKLDGVTLDPAPNGEMFLSATMQLIERNIDVFALWVEAVVHRSGRRPLVFIDECHTGSESNSWGGAVADLVKAGAQAVLLTATAVRADGKRIPGFGFDVVDEEPVTVVKHRPGSVPEVVRVEVWEGTRRRLRLRAHHETTFSEAWAETPRVLCKVGRVPFDVELSKIHGLDAEEGLLLSGMTTTVDVRRALSRAVRAPVVVGEGTRMLVQELRRFRTVASDAAAIVFCGNDDDREDRSVNKHAGEIKKAIVAADPALDVVVATSADAGKERLEAFVAGRGDVLVVKQMAGMGLDAERLKVGLDLSAVRTEAAYTQRLMRIATPYRGIGHAVWIGLADILGQAIFDALVTNSGGAATAAELELVRAHEVPRRDEREDGSVYAVDGTDGADFDDSDRNRGAKEQMAVVERLLDAFPQMTAIYSHAEIASRASMFGVVPAADEVAGWAGARDTHAEVEALYGDINNTADDITEARMRLGGYGRGEFGAIRTHAFVDAYRFASVPIGTELRDVRAIGTLRMIRDRLRRILAEVEEARHRG